MPYLFTLYINIREWERVQAILHSARRRIVRRRSTRKTEDETIPNLTVPRTDRAERRKTARRTRRIRSIEIVPNQKVKIKIER